MLDFRVNAELENLSKITDFISSATQKLGLDESKGFDVQVAVGETCENIAKYSYPEDKKGAIEIGCKLEGNDFIVIIKYQGMSFNPDSVPQPDVNASLEERRVGGLGVYFMKSLMDEVNYSFDAEKGNELVMIKKDCLI
ncbi:MAG: ATP-binding protein [bacterium]|nr:ATP-binding protein [bacterium]